MHFSSVQRNTTNRINWKGIFPHRQPINPSLYAKRTPLLYFLSELILISWRHISYSTEIIVTSFIGIAIAISMLRCIDRVAPCSADGLVAVITDAFISGRKYLFEYFGGRTLTDVRNAIYEHVCHGQFLRGSCLGMCVWIVHGIWRWRLIGRR